MFEELKPLFNPLLSLSPYMEVYSWHEEDTGGRFT
jgi:hypothetical protein